MDGVCFNFVPLNSFFPYKVLSIAFKAILAEQLVRKPLSSFYRLYVCAVLSRDYYRASRIGRHFWAISIARRSAKKHLIPLNRFRFESLKFKRGSQRRTIEV